MRADIENALLSLSWAKQAAGLRQPIIEEVGELTIIEP